MSWSGLASNQCVSGINLNDAVINGYFNAKTSIPLTNKELTAYEAYSYVDIYDTGKPVNQLVVKSNLTAQPTNPTNPVYYFRVYGIAGDYYTYDSYAVVSVNGGVTFARYSGLPIDKRFTCIAGSSNGQFIGVGSGFTANSFYLSTNFGGTFTNVTLPDPIGFFSNPYIADIDMSSDGRVIAVLLSTAGTIDSYVTVSVSNNYGASFTTSTVYKQTASVGKLAVSGNGNYIQYVAFNAFGNYSWRVYSSNSGATFNASSNSTNQLFTAISLSDTGQYQLIVNSGTNGSTGNMFVSSNYGSTFPSKSTYGLGAYCAMESSGASMTVMRNKNQIAYSQNYGNNWTAKTVGNDSAYGLTSGDYATPSYPYAYTAISIIPSNIGYINYSQANSFPTVYTQQVTYNMNITALCKKAFRI